MANQRSKNKTHFTAATEKELKAAIEKYASANGIDRNTALRILLWQSSERAGTAKAPDQFWKEVAETKAKIAAKKKSAKK